MDSIRVGVIDVGSNSIKLLIVENGKGNGNSQVLFTVEEVRIGEGLTGSPPVIDRNAIIEGTDAVSRLYSIASEHQLKSLSIVATSAVRDAQNRDEFIRAIRKSIGKDIKVLTGAEEARLIGKGIQQDPTLSSLQNFTLADLGGGSLECIQFLNQVSFSSQSFNLGAVRLTSQYVENRMNPIRPKERKDIEAVVKTTLQASPLNPNSESAEAVLTGGSASILSKLIANSKDDPPTNLETIRAFRDQVCQRSCRERVSELNIPQERADIFPAATIILCELLDFFRCESAYFSFYNLRYGITAELIEESRST